jgi:hypothetical protein
MKIGYVRVSNQEQHEAFTLLRRGILDFMNDPSTVTRK